MLHLKIDTVGVETQREVVKEERRQGLENQPYGSVWEETFKHAYKIHPYNWTPIGSAQYIDQATLDEFMSFYKNYYVPENATLTIAGDIDIDKTEDLVERYFSEIPKGEKEINRPNIIEPEQTSEIKDTVYDNIQLPAVIEAYHIPALGTEDYYAIDMLTTLLATGQSSRLYKVLVDQQQKAVYVGAFPAGLEDPGLFIAFAVANVGVQADSLENSIDEEIKKVKNELISAEEFQKLRNQIETQFVSENATVAGVAENLSEYHVFFGDTDLINTEIEKYMDVTREDIKRAAQKYLKDSNRVILYYLPKSAQTSMESK
jgi:predicted Zn-dependent peptidase